MLKTSTLCRLLVECTKHKSGYTGWLVIEENGGYGGVNLQFRTTSEPKAANLLQLHDVPRIKRALEYTGKYKLITLEFVNR